jgi:maltose alpha-D-glucosyltransferase/alpha-amylase
MRRLIAMHKRWKAFGLGTFEMAHSENRKIIAFVRQRDTERILTVINLSRFAQPCEIELSAHAGLTPVELFSRANFPVIGATPYFLTLAPHSFLWFSLERNIGVAGDPVGVAPGAEPLPLLTVKGTWEEILNRSNVAALETAIEKRQPARPWFWAKGKRPRSARIMSLTPVGAHPNRTFLALVQFELVQGEPDTYLIPLAFGEGKLAEAIRRDYPAAIIARLKKAGSDAEGIVFDAAASRGFGRALLDIIARRREIRSNNTVLEGSATPLLPQLLGAEDSVLVPSLVKAKQANTTIAFGTRLNLKLFRRLETGINPDLELHLFLAARKFPLAPPLAGMLEFRSATNESMTLGILTGRLPAAQNGWDFTLETLSRRYERAVTMTPGEAIIPSPDGPLYLVLETPPSPSVLERMGTYAEAARKLGESAAALHSTLASEPLDPAFAPEPYTIDHQRSVFQTMRGLVRQTLRLVAGRMAELNPEDAALARQAVASENEILQRLQFLRGRRINAVRIRVHGDFHLGQTLHTGKEFFVTNFEGEPFRPLSVRRMKRNPLRDAAGMIWSFHRASFAALVSEEDHGLVKDGRADETAAWARSWSDWAGAIFWQSYRAAGRGGGFLPPDQADARALLEVYLLERALVDLEDCLTASRIERLEVAARGLLRALGATGEK